MKKLFCILTVLFVSVFLFAEQPIVHNIRSEAGKGYKINIFWTVPDNPEKEITGFLVYRDTRHIASYSQIKNITPIATLTADYTGYTDTVSDFNDYFYCVITLTEETKTPYDLILLSYNSTVKGVHLAINTKQSEPVKEEKEKLYYEGTSRETPLPFIDMQNDLIVQPTISDETASITESLITKKGQKQPLLKPYIFEEDLISPDGGDDYLLFDILKQYFVQKNYKETITQLHKLAGTNIKDTTRNRVYFYIGEAEYLMGEYENAVKSFVKVQNVYPTLAKKWINSALDRI